MSGQGSGSIAYRQLSGTTFTVTFTFNFTVLGTTLHIEGSSNSGPLKGSGKVYPISIVTTVGGEDCKQFTATNFRVIGKVAYAKDLPTS